MCVIKIVTIKCGKSDFPYHDELLLRKEFAPSGSKFFPLREVPIQKGKLLKRITS